MRIIKLKKIIIFLLIIGAMVIITGCARWPDGPGPGPGGTEYQLEITVEVSGVINDSSNGFYYIKLEDGFFDFAQVQDDFESIFDGGSFSGNTIQVTIALSDLGKPNSVDINVITTDSDNNTYDHLDGYFTINTSRLGATGEGVISGSGSGGADFDITKVTAVITTLY